jgi:alpha-beta hydrolase superfamily lysophospholipase
MERTMKEKRPENDADIQIRAFLDEIAEKRGTGNPFDRFEQDAVTSAGLELHLDVIGVDPKRPTVVFMPGTNAYAVLYGEFLAALADKEINIVGFDPRGHGRSGGMRGSYTIPELMADMRAAVEYARNRFGDPIVVSGSSQGGITAFYLAAEGYPVAGAICHNLADLGDPASRRLTRRPGLSRLMKPIIGPLARLLPELRIPVTSYINLQAEPIRGLGNSKDLLYQGPLLVPFIRLKAMASLAGEKLPCPVEAISTPVLILHGEKDVIFPLDYIESLYNRLTCRKSLKVYPGFHHYILFDHVDAVLPDVLQWMEDTCRGIQ